MLINNNKNKLFPQSDIRQQ